MTPQPTYGTRRVSQVVELTIANGTTTSEFFDYSQSAALAIETASNATYTIEARSHLPGGGVVELLDNITAADDLISLDADQLATIYPFRELRLKIDAAAGADIPHAIHLKS